ncbi:MAG: recombination protein RecR [FCB group bacterium]|nr:recombination protein RecR [FCB group bacterium]
MTPYPPSLERVIQSLVKLPGIGQKTARRLGFFLLTAEKEDVIEMAKSLEDLTKYIQFCENCHSIAEGSLCEICKDPHRDQGTICVVEEPADIFIFERTGFRGLYHVIGGVLSPLDGVGPDDLNLQDLLKRASTAKEIILAINASIEGETTTLFLTKLLADQDVTVTRLARGLPVGGNLEYVDDLTISRSLSERVKVNNG